MTSMWPAETEHRVGQAREDLMLRPLTVADEHQALQAHEELARDDFDFLLDLRGTLAAAGNAITLTPRLLLTEEPFHELVAAAEKVGELARAGPGLGADVHDRRDLCLRDVLEGRGIDRTAERGAVAGGNARGCRPLRSPGLTTDRTGATLHLPEGEYPTQASSSVRRGQAPVR